MNIQLEFISSEILKDKEGEEKVDYILDRVHENKIIVLEESLSFEDRKNLMQKDMEQIDDEFTGIEFDTLDDTIGKSWTQNIKRKIIKMLGGKTGGLMVIGPSRLIREIKKHPQKISMLAGKSDQD